jgi:acetyltransferase
MGEDAAQNARLRFADASIASFRTPEGAVGAFMHMVQYRRNQKLLSETPDSISDKVPYQPQKAQAIIARALAEERNQLTSAEAIALLNDYGINTFTEIVKVHIHCVSRCKLTRCLVRSFYWGRRRATGVCGATRLLHCHH